METAHLLFRVGRAYSKQEMSFIGKDESYLKSPLSTHTDTLQKALVILKFAFVTRIAIVTRIVDPLWQPTIIEYRNS